MQAPDVRARAPRAAASDPPEATRAPARNGGPECAPAAPWLAIVGVGEAGLDSLTPPARARIEAAELVFGGARHLERVAPLVRGRAHPWPRPFDPELAQVRAARGRAVCVLASGDPFHFGVGALLARYVPAEERIAIPGVSAFSLAAARLGWSLPGTRTLSLHGRPLDRIRPELQPGARLLVLTSGADAPADLAQLLCATGFKASPLWVLERLGGPRERLRSASAERFELTDIDPLHVVAIECRAERTARVLARSAGRATELFEHDGQITRPELRALALARLAPRRGERLWDVGAGSGAVAIEWLLADPTLHAVAIEASPERAARIRRNASACGVPELTVVEGRAPFALEPLPPPDAIFVGGGARAPGLIEHCLRVLPGGGRLVVHAVTLETEAELGARQARHGGELRRIAIESAEALGPHHGWRPARPIVQWSWERP